MKVGDRFYSEELKKYGTVKKHCNDKFWWYVLDGEKELQEGSTAPKDLRWIDICYQCGADCKDHLYQVKVIDEIGKVSHEKVCSENCAIEVKQEVYLIHQNRADEIKNQKIQKLR